MVDFPQGGDFTTLVGANFNLVSKPSVSDITPGFIYATPEKSSSYTEYNRLSSISSFYNSAVFSATYQGLHGVYLFLGEVDTAHFFVEVNSVTEVAHFMANVPSSVFSFWRMAQFNPGVLPHWSYTFSDLYIYDVFSSTFTYDSLAIHRLESIFGKLFQETDIDSTGNLVQTDYYSNIVGTVDPCVGDEEPPFIVYNNPTASGLKLRPLDQVVDFNLSDPIGGVDVSTLNVNYYRSSTGLTLPLISGGGDQTGGLVSITGDPLSYRVIFTPDFTWVNNERVVVDIEVFDRLPIVGGDPFFCEDNVPNYFAGDIPFNVLNDAALNATLNVIGDIDAPYINFTSPASGTIGNNIFAPIILKIKDDLTGVDISTLNVAVDGKQLILNGSTQTEEAIIGGSPLEYTIIYTPVQAFEYDATVAVNIAVDDLNEVGPANSLITSYSYDTITEGTLIIENFKPEVGTHHNLTNLDIEVDLRDDTYGVNTDQSFFVINGTIASGTQTVLASGIRLTYHPPNDFAFEAPIRVTVHAVNDNTAAPVVKEEFFNLFYGCRLFFDNKDSFDYADDVSVFVHARNLERFHKDLSTGYFFSTYTQPQENLGASIVGITPWEDLTASIVGESPEHRYGEIVTVEITVEDFEGHILGPYTYTYTIENK